LGTGKCTALVKYAQSYTCWWITALYTDTEQQLTQRYVRLSMGKTVGMCMLRISGYITYYLLLLLSGFLIFWLLK